MGRLVLRLPRDLRAWGALLALSGALAGAGLPAALAGAAGPVPAVGPRPGSSGGACAGSPPGCGQGPGFATDLAAGSWSVMRTAPLRPRSFATVVWTGSQLVVWGGVASIGGRLVPVSDGAVWDQATGTWHAMAPSPLSAREGAAGAWDGHDVFVCGGDNASEHQSSYRLFSDGALYDPGANTWRRLPRSPLSARTQASATWTGSELLVLGGGDLDAPVVLPTTDRDGAAFVPSTRTWQSLPPVPTARGNPVGISWAWSGTRLFAWVTDEVVHRSGNEMSININHVAASWAPGAGSWHRLPAPPVPTYGASVTWTGDDFVFLGGSYCLPLMFCPLALARPLPTYDPATGRWASLPAAPRADLVPVAWTGHALITPGGNAPGAALDPGTPHWQALPPSPLGPPDGASAVWTGRQLLVWGGFGPLGRGSNAGALLTPKARPAEVPGAKTAIATSTGPMGRLTPAARTARARTAGRQNDACVPQRADVKVVSEGWEPVRTEQTLTVRPGKFVGVEVYTNEIMYLPAKDIPPGFPWAKPVLSTKGVLVPERECPPLPPPSSVPTAVYYFQAARTGTTVVTVPLTKAWRKFRCPRRDRPACADPSPLRVAVKVVA